MKARVLWAEKTVYANQQQSASESSAYNITFSGFDTLSGYQRTATATDPESYAEIHAEATRNVAGGLNLDQRVKDVLKSLNVSVEYGKMVGLTAEQCEKICRTGLLVELMFLRARA